MMAIVGATIDLGLVWSISDTFSALFKNVGYSKKYPCKKN